MVRYQYRISVRLYTSSVECMSTERDNVSNVIVPDDTQWEVHSFLSIAIDHH